MHNLARGKLRRVMLEKDLYIMCRGDPELVIEKLSFLAIEEYPCGKMIMRRHVWPFWQAFAKM